MKRSSYIGLLPCLLAALSFSVVHAASAPDWWIGPKDEYDTMVKEAKKEGHLVLWSHPDPECTPLIAGPFEQAYGIKVEHTEYTTAQIVQRIMLEGVAGMYTVDVGNLSVHHVPRLEQRGLLQKLNYRENVTT
jgi:spermidine/putrescine-binding protein